MTADLLLPCMFDSISAPLPKGWTAEVFTSCDQTYRRAVDPEGCRWYWTDGEWILNVPYFRSTARLMSHDDLAIVDCVRNELRPYPITASGVICIGKRRIPPKRWNH